MWDTYRFFWNCRSYRSWRANFVKDQHKTLIVGPWTGWIFWFIANFECVGKTDYRKDWQKVNLCRSYDSDRKILFLEKSALTWVCFWTRPRWVLGSPRTDTSGIPPHQQWCLLLVWECGAGLLLCLLSLFQNTTLIQLVYKLYTCINSFHVFFYRLPAQVLMGPAFASLTKVINNTQNRNGDTLYNTQMESAILCQKV